MSNNNIFSYTSRSLETSRAEGMNKIPIISRGDWTDLNPTDPGMVLLDYVHALVDMIQFYQDHNALEVFISTAKERKNIFRIANQLFYKIPSAKGARVDVKFYLDVIYDTTIYIPKYTTLSTNTDIKFLTLEDAYIVPGSIEVTVPCVQGELGIEYYEGTGISRFSNIEFPENQKYILSRPNIDIDTITISDDIDYMWTPVDSIIFSDGSEKVYQAVLNYDGSISIIFGDGTRGMIPQGGETLLIQYIYSLAEEGRTGANTITNIKDPIYDLRGNPVRIFVTNPESTAGGSGPQSEEDIVAYAPGAIKAQDRAVTISDFENLAKLIDGVADAKAYDINNTDPEDNLQPYEVIVYIIPEVGSSVNNSLIKSVYDYLQKRIIPPTILQVRSTNPVELDIEVNIVRNPSYIEGGVEHEIQTKLTEYFNNRLGAIGQPFIPGELYTIISAIPGVRYVDSITPSTNIEIPKFSIVTMRSLKVNIV